MSKKKESRKAQSSDEKVKEFIEHLKQYDDWGRFFSKGKPFLLMLPCSFSLKIGQENVGKILIDWKSILGKLVDVAALMSKPDEVSDEEHARQLLSNHKSATREEIQETLSVFYKCLFYMMEHLPEKLNSGALQLCAEARQNLIIEEQKKRGSKNIPSAAKFAEWVAKMEEDATKKRLPEIRGGSDPEVEVSDEQCAMLSADYPALLQHWRKTRRYYKSGANWRGHAKVDQQDTPDDLLDKLGGLDSYEQQASTLAHEHAARRCGIPANTYSLSSLSRLRRRGDKIRGQSKSSD